MTEEEAKAVKNQEAGAPEAQTEAVVQQEPPKEPQPGSKEYNFRQLERERDEYKRKALEQEQYNREVLTLLKGNLQPQAQPPQEESLPDLAPDDIPEWKHVQKTFSSLKNEIKQLKDELVQKEKAELPKIVKAKYPDFDSVVTSDRIKQLEQENPALAQAFTLSSDPYTATYSYLKALYQERKPDPVALEEAEKILENSKKPVSTNALGASGALKNARAFQKKSKDQLYQEMMECARRVN